MLLAIEIRWPILAEPLFVGHGPKGVARDAAVARKFSTVPDATIYAESHAGDYPGATLGVVEVESG